MGRILGIDFGLTRIGLALSDERKIIASPFKTILTQKSTSLSVEHLLKELKALSIELIVVGLPLRLNGKHSMMTDEVCHFVACLKEKTPCPVITWDERLTTLQAEKALMESTLNRKDRSKKIDIVSAALLLQNYLDKIQIQNDHTDPY